MSDLAHEKLKRWGHQYTVVRHCRLSVEVEKALRIAAHKGFDAAVEWLERQAK